MSVRLQRKLHNNVLKVTHSFSSGKTKIDMTINVIITFTIAAHISQRTPKNQATSQAKILRQERERGLRSFNPSLRNSEAAKIGPCNTNWNFHYRSGTACNYYKTYSFYDIFMELWSCTKKIKRLGPQFAFNLLQGIQRIWTLEIFRFWQNLTFNMGIFNRISLIEIWKQNNASYK